MELVYLWVEKYKNIEKQGFNLSSKFKCEFKAKYKENGALDEKNSELIIEENENYVNLFSENINITAIVGKNGSGKSSVLELVSLVSMKNLYKNILVILKKGNKFYYLFNDDFKIKCNLEVEKISLNLINLNTVFFSMNFTNGILDGKYNYFSTLKYKFFVSRSENREINFRNQSLFSFFINSSRFFSNFLDNSVYKVINAVNLQQLNEWINLSKRLIILDFIYYFPLHYFTPKELYLELIKSDLEIKFNSNNIKNSIEEFINENFSPILEPMIKKLELHPNYEKIIKIKNQIFSLIDNKNTYFNKLDVNLPIDIGLEFVHLFIELLLLLDIDKIVKIPFEINFKRLSNGEENFLLMIALIELGIKSFFSKNNKSKKIKIYLLLDEIETNFHPNWQKDLIIRFINYLSLINKHIFEYKLSCHLIFATHSPFIISDLPKQNIIFLDKDENGKCRVVDGLNEKKETFGANIHTLLSDSFFMEDGLMGEFAKSKIQEIIDFLNDKKTLDEISIEQENIIKLIECIGEPFLKRKLLDMYYEKFENEALKKARKEQLLTEKKRIEEELKKYD